jgi:PAS domain-containing protein
MNPAAEKIFGYSLAVRDPHSDQLVGVSARAAPIQAPDGRMLGAVASYADITELCRARDELELRVQERTAELTQANAALCESERAYRTLAENLPGIVYRVFVRENNRLQFFNKVAPKVTGYAEEELAPGQICSIEPHIRIAFATSRTGTLSHGA